MSKRRGKYPKVGKVGKKVGMDALHNLVINRKWYHKLIIYGNVYFTIIIYKHDVQQLYEYTLSILQGLNP